MRHAFRIGSIQSKKFSLQIRRLFHQTPELALKVRKDLSNTIKTHPSRVLDPPGPSPRPASNTTNFYGGRNPEHPNLVTRFYSEVEPEPALKIEETSSVNIIRTYSKATSDPPGQTPESAPNKKRAHPDEVSYPLKIIKYGIGSEENPEQPARIQRYNIDERSDLPRFAHRLLDSKSHNNTSKHGYLEHLISKSAERFSKSRLKVVKMSTETASQNSSRKTHSFIQFMTTPTADTPGTALLLHFDEKRYVVGNVHEGTSRAGLQIGARVFRSKDFFITGKTEWRSNGGVLGMILSLTDASRASAESKAEDAKAKSLRRMAREEEERANLEKPGKKGRHNMERSRRRSIEIKEVDPTITLHGGPNLTHTIATARSFIFRRGVPIKVLESHVESRSRPEDRSWEPTWADDCIQVWAMAISPSSGEGSPPGTPRKRSLGEYMNGQAQKFADPDDQWSPNPKPPVDEEKRDQQVRDFVVSEMFSSAWRADNLVETSLRDVKMPTSLFVRDPHTQKIVKYTGPYPDGTTYLPNIKVLVKLPWPGALVDNLPPTKPSKVAMSYIIRNHKQRGKFKPEAARALKVPEGPLFSKLAKGSEVLSTDGKIITPDMVLEPGKEGAGIAIIDLPTKEYIPDLISRPEWSADKVINGVDGIIWILGPGVSSEPSLRAFIESKAELKHVISSSDHCPNYLVQTSAASEALRHNQIDPLRFPIPVHSNVAPTPLDLPTVVDKENSPQLISAKRGLRIELEPKFGLSEKDIVRFLNTAEVVQATPDKVIRLAQAAQREIKSNAAQKEYANQGLPGHDAEIICLGTGSAIPSPYRNVAGTLLRVPGQGSYLLDCGEDTLGQLKRIFTESELAEVLQDLKMIWISHLHADHHLGITSVIKAWYEEVHGKDPAKRRRPNLTEALLDPIRFLEEGKRLFIVGHRHMMRWLEEYSTVEDFGYSQLIPLISLSAHCSWPEQCVLKWNGVNLGFKTAKDPRMVTAMQKATGLSNLIAVDVNHCYGSQAVSLVFPDGFKFSYSGDCRPSNQFAITGKGSTVLLHEATFDDTLVGDAVAKKHSTTSEAVGVGVAMGAKRVLLTHFSQRYQNIPSIESMKSVGVKLEDTGEHEDPMEGMDPPVNIEDDTALETMGSTVEAEETSILEEGQNTGNGAMEPRKERNTPTETIPANPQSTNKSSPVDDMKIGVAFDYMRVRVGDIIHLEKFNPALSELYKEDKKEEAKEKAKRASKEASALSEGAHKSTPESKKKVDRSKRTGGAQKEIQSTPTIGTTASNSKASPPSSSVPVEPLAAPSPSEIEKYRRRYQKLESPTKATAPDAASSGL